MDYKEKYERALKVITQIKDANYDNKALLDFIEYKYPQLKESEDERVIKDIIHYIEQKQFGSEPYFEDDDVVQSYLTWLEKQGEQKPIDDKIHFDFSSNIPVTTDF